MKILLIDNYDSFTYNLFQCVRLLTDSEISVFRNDKLPLEDVAQYDKIILSPGPGLPADNGILLPLISRYASSKSILGVCLGHQAIGEAFGARLRKLDQVFHGRSSPVYLKKFVPKEDELFKGINSGFIAGRYHSWIVSKESFPDELEITAEDKEGTIMGLQHKSYDVQGIQFHPESILTPVGNQIIKNFLNQ